MNIEISAVTKLEPSVTQYLLPELSNLVSRLEIINNRKVELKNKLSQKSDYDTKATIKPVKLIVIIFVLFLVVGSMLTCIDINKGENVKAAILYALCFIIPVGLPVGIALYQNKTYSALSLKANGEIIEVADQVAIGLEAVKNDYNYIPPTMLNPFAIKKLIEIIQYNRADAWMNALNLVEKEMENNDVVRAQAILDFLIDGSVNEASQRIVRH